MTCPAIPLKTVGTKSVDVPGMSSRAFHIVCAVDRSEFSESVIEHALDEARRYPNVILHFITILEEGKGIFSSKEPAEAELEEADNCIRRLVAEALPAFADDNGEANRQLRFHTRAGEPANEVVELAFESRAERVVVGRFGARQRRGKMGSIAERVVDKAPCTVHVVQPSDYEGLREDYERCPECAQIREQSRDGMWFCPEHLDGRSKRLARANVGIGSPTPGWGVH